jgi:hypothetical protein
MELTFDRAVHIQERLAFIRPYAAWVRSVPDPVWSARQVVLVDSLLENARNMPLSSKEYLDLVVNRRHPQRKQSKRERC